MPNMKPSHLLLILFSGLLLVPAHAWATELIINGGFELNGGAGTSLLTGWTVSNFDSNASGSWYAQTGSSSPVNGFPVQPPPQGNYAAMTDGTGPSSQALIQSFTAAAGPGTFTLSFDYFYSYGSFNGTFPWGSSYTPPSTLDYNFFSNTGQLNDQAIVNLLSSGAGAFDNSGPTVVQHILRLNPTSLGDPNSNLCFPELCSYTSVSVPLTGLVGGDTYQLQFAEVDDQGAFNFGVDQVSLRFTPAVPEPSSFALIASGMAALALFVVRRKVRTVSGV